MAEQTNVKGLAMWINGDALHREPVRNVVGDYNLMENPAYLPIVCLFWEKFSYQQLLFHSICYV